MGDQSFGNPGLCSRDRMNGSALQRADAQVPLAPEQSNGMLGPPCAIWLHERLRVAMHDWELRTFAAQESFLMVEFAGFHDRSRRRRPLC